MLSLNQIAPSKTRTRIVDVVGGNGTVVPVPVINCYTALGIPAYRRAMSFISENLASFPRSVWKDGAAIAGPHPLNRMLALKPNSYQNAFVFWRTLYLHAAHTGNGYARIRRDSTTFGPISLHNLLPEDVRPLRIVFFDGSDPIQLYQVTSSKELLFAEEVIHLQGLGYDGMAGIDPVSLHESAIQGAAILDRYKTEYLKKGTMLRGAVEVPAEMDDDQMLQMRAELRKFSGSEATDDIIILPAGAKLNNATTSASDSKIIEQAAASTKGIAQLTGVPPEFLFERGESKYTGIEEAGETVVRYTLRLWFEQAEDELSLKLLTEAEQDAGLTIHIDPDELVRGDSDGQMTTAVAGVAGGLLTENEGRAKIGQPRIEGPDVDRLKRSGDTSPPPSPAEAGRQTASAPRTAADAFSALAPIIAAACDRVDTKTEKAFAANDKKTGQDRTIWVNVFAEEQTKYASAALGPIAQALASFGLPGSLDVDAIAQKYGNAVRHRGATGSAPRLIELAHSCIEVEASCKTNADSSSPPQTPPG